jgi:hypothetical protein
VETDEEENEDDDEDEIPVISVRFFQAVTSDFKAAHPRIDDSNSAVDTSPTFVSLAGRFDGFYR